MSYEIVATADGSNTLFSKEYNQHYHNPDDGAVNESLQKHVIPCLEFHKDKKELNILDICFGLGYNTLATIYYIKKENLDIKLNIYSPELDEKLINTLKNFEYPTEFNDIKYIIDTLCENFSYKDDKFNIKILIGDARKHIKNLENDFFDIIYQDAFSSEVNIALWSKEYFDEIYRISKNSVIMSTYAIATPIRLSMYEAGFDIYEHIPSKRKITLAFKEKQDKIGKYIDMELKKQRNKEAKAIYDYHIES